MTVAVVGMAACSRRDAPPTHPPAIEDESLAEMRLAQTPMLVAVLPEMRPPALAKAAEPAACPDGMILVEGHGMMGKLEIETPSLIRFGEMTKDECFVTACAAQQGVSITNRSDKENLVMLKHFGPGNPDAAAFIA